MKANYDVLIIGSGAAGLSLALNLPSNLRVGVISKGELRDSSTFWAQGGISAVIDDEDSFESHIQDTLDAGAGLCDKKAVEFTVKNAPKIISWLEKMGMPFTPDADEASGIHLTREGGHTHRRVAHSDDATGRALQNTLVIHAEQLGDNVELIENAIAVDLITPKKLKTEGEQKCLGAYVLNIPNDKVNVVNAKITVLATGGANKVYLYSSNPDGSSGDGIAMAWRAGCRVANMEFMQFHPTCLYHPEAKSFLITEAVRGEGGILRLPNGEAFMHKYDDRKDLAPRDIVARAIDNEMKRGGIDCVYLDITHEDKNFLKNHFPNIHQRCKELGIKMHKNQIPVVPASHYTCGGVMTDLDGQTDLPNLFALGETTYTGLHGANRLASNSLLECMVFGHAAATKIEQTIDSIDMPAPSPEWDDSQVISSDEAVVVSHNWDEVRRMMWDYVGIVRTDKRLERATHRIDLLISEIDEYYGNFKVSSDLIELRNLSQVAKLIIESAKLRKESRGLHFTVDYPELDPNSEPSVLVPNYLAGRFGIG